ncbi:hypothetical protein Theco_3389 [Thermobacillus composti KWC4]|uniref:Uncharacterized protein n=1 Tax=Thermobacillus composti (strain DSM 18247 / JCM 13945 / KWC4) TaxID=717605 RepID=L0EI13_THECK|nr:hypothetical protein [Thermobacillus composti]AGA59437.1 hypothetical protein Theco_3389 [Thermobacillus composti KWC4]
MRRIDIRRATQVVAVLHLLMALYLLIAVLFRNIFYPKLHTPDVLTIGEKIVLYTCVPQVVLYATTGILLLVGKRGGWYFPQK